MATSKGSNQGKACDVDRFQPNQRSEPLERRRFPSSYAMRKELSDAKRPNAPPIKAIRFANMAQASTFSID